MAYDRTLSRVETYFDRTATRTWEALTSDAPVSGIRATVRAGRDRMRAIILSRMPRDLTGLRILDAGCGTGALAHEMARLGIPLVPLPPNEDGDPSQLVEPVTNPALVDSINRASKVPPPWPAEGRTARVQGRRVE